MDFFYYVSEEVFVSSNAPDKAINLELISIVAFPVNINLGFHIKLRLLTKWRPQSIFFIRDNKLGRPRGRHIQYLLHGAKCLLFDPILVHVIGILKFILHIVRNIQGVEHNVLPFAGLGVIHVIEVNL